MTSASLTAPSKATTRASAGRNAAIFGVVLLALGILAVYMRIFRSDLHPQLVLFFYSIPANSAVSVFSHEIALYDYGSHQPLLLTTLSATLGTIVAAYLDWKIFVPLLDWDRIGEYRGNRVYRWAIDRFQRAPFVTLVVTGFTPIPFFPFKFLAFSMKYPLWRYIAAVTVARAPRYLLLAWMGREFRVPEWVLVGLFVSLLSFALYHQVRGRALLDWNREP